MRTHISRSVWYKFDTLSLILTCVTLKFSYFLFRSHTSLFFVPVSFASLPPLLLAQFFPPDNPTRCVPLAQSVHGRRAPLSLTILPDFSQFLVACHLLADQSLLTKLLYLERSYGLELTGNPRRGVSFVLVVDRWSRHWIPRRFCSVLPLRTFVPPGRTPIGNQQSVALRGVD